jgi:hypothetical protein
VDTIILHLLKADFAHTFAKTGRCRRVLA